MYIYFTESLHGFGYGAHAKPFQRQFYCANHVKQIEQETARKKANKLNRKDQKKKKRKMLGKGIEYAQLPFYTFWTLSFCVFIIYVSLGWGIWLSSWSPAPSSACIAEAVAIWTAASEQNLGNEQWGCLKTIQIMATPFYS